MKSITKAPTLDHGVHDVTAEETVAAMREAIGIAKDGSTSWHMTRGGQIVRLDTTDGARVQDRDRAMHDLAGLVDDETMARLFPEWDGDDENTAMGHGWNLAIGDHGVLEVVPETARVSTYGGPGGAGRAVARIEEAARRPWHVGTREATVCERTLAAIAAGKISLGVLRK